MIHIDKTEVDQVKWTDDFHLLNYIYWNPRDELLKLYHNDILDIIIDIKEKNWQICRI